MWVSTVDALPTAAATAGGEMPTGTLTEQQPLDPGGHAQGYAFLTQNDLPCWKLRYGREGLANCTVSAAINEASIKVMLRGHWWLPVSEAH